MSEWERAEKLENKVHRINEHGEPPQGYGLCSNCTHFRWTITQYGKERVTCTCYGEPHEFMQLKTSDTVVNCSSFYRRGELSIQEMLGMATIINIKKPMGFSGGMNEVEIKPPKEDEE